MLLAPVVSALPHALVLVVLFWSRRETRNTVADQIQQMQEQMQQMQQMQQVLILFVVCSLFHLHYRIHRQSVQSSKQRDLDRLEHGLHFADIWNVWDSQNTNFDAILEMLDGSATKNDTRTRSSRVYNLLREKYKKVVDKELLQFPVPLDDIDLNMEPKKRSGNRTSIFQGPDKSLAHIIPSSSECSWFYGFVAEWMVGVGASSEAELSGEELAMRRYLLVHDQTHGLKYSRRNLLPLPRDHEEYFDKCHPDCLLIIPILDGYDAMMNWHGEAYDVIAVGSSPDVYKWMKLQGHVLEEKPPTDHEINMASQLLCTSIAMLVGALVKENEGTISDGKLLVDDFEKNVSRSTPTTVPEFSRPESLGTTDSSSMGRSQSVAASQRTTSSDSSLSKESKKRTSKAISKGAEKRLRKLQSVKGKIKEKGFPMPVVRTDVAKPLLKVSFKEKMPSSSIPDPMALAIKAAINWSAFATTRSMKLHTGCRVSPPTVMEDSDFPDLDVGEEPIALPRFINVPTIKELTRPTPITDTAE